MTKVTALGLMSGTSMDGIDLAVVRTDGEGLVERGPSMAVSYDASFRKRLEEALHVAKQITVRTERPGPLAEIEQELTTLHAEAVKRFLKKHGDQWRPDIVGFHGQTVLHRPREALTVQIGDGEALARSIGIRVAYDMRAEDMRHGGQGAPLVPAYHVALAASLPESDKRMPLCFVNIGGISNMTYIPRDGSPIAFDSGPGNALIDQWVFQKAGLAFDEDGNIASKGVVVPHVVDEYLANPFFEKAGPKSLDRNDFDLQPVKDLGLEDGARTLGAVTAEAIMRASEHLPEKPKTWIICGGGQKNRFIIKYLRELAESNHGLLKLADELGFDGDFMEAEAWAYLAVRALRGLPLTFPTTTGCREPVSGGVIVEPA